MYRIMILPKDYNILKLAEYNLEKYTKMNKGYFFTYPGFNSYTVNLNKKLCKLWLLNHWVDREVYEILRDGADLEVYLHFSDAKKSKSEKNGHTVHLNIYSLLTNLKKLLKDM